MTVLEQKVDALVELAMVKTKFQQKQAVEKLKRLMDAPQEAESIWSQEAGSIGAQDSEAVTRKIMAELGCPDRMMGYDYAVYAIGLAVEDQKIMRNITIMLYPAIAQKFDTTANRAERAIRHLVDVAWSRGDPDTLEKYFGNTVDPNKGKPTNGEFLARMANIVRQKTKAEGKYESE